METTGKGGIEYLGVYRIFFPLITEIVLHIYIYGVPRGSKAQKGGKSNLKLHRNPTRMTTHALRNINNLDYEYHPLFLGYSSGSTNRFHLTVQHTRVSLISTLLMVLFLAPWTYAGCILWAPHTS